MSDQYITGQDTKIFNYLFEHKIARVDQIKRDLFSNLDISNVYRRLAKLKNYSLIRSRSVENGIRSAKAFYLTSRGLNILKESFPYEIDQEVMKSDSPAHDLRLVDVVGKVKSFSFVDKCISENVFRCCSAFIDDSLLRPFSLIRSDIYCRLKKNNKCLDVAIEYENISKNNSRYKEKLKNYYKEKKIELVFYIVGSDSTMNRLFKIDRKVGPKSTSKLYVCTEKLFFKEMKSSTFTNCFGHKIILR